MYPGASLTWLRTMFIDIEVLFQGRHPDYALVDLRYHDLEHTLQATALVNEAYLRLADYRRTQWQNRSHFFAVSAQVMRRVLVDHARRHNDKRGRGHQHVPVEDAMIAAPDTGDDVDLVALDDALVALGQLDPRKAQIVEMRFFGGLTVEEIGDALSLSAGTIKRDWRAAKAWLYHELTRESGDGRGTLGAD